MSKQGWVECLATAQFVGNTIVSNTSSLSILPSQARYVFPNGYLDLVGKTLRVSARGQATANATTPGTLQLGVLLSNTSAVVGVLANTGPMTLNTSQINNASWEYECLITARAVGSTANVMSIGTFISGLVGSGAGSGGPAGTWIFPANTPVTSTAFDGTQALQLDLQATWSASNANNTITLMLYALEALN